MVAAIFSPLAFAGATSQLTTGWVRKWIEWMVALIVSKLILIFMFIIGYGVLFASLGEPADATGSQKITNVVIGTLILAMAGFTPWQKVAEKITLEMMHRVLQNTEENWVESTSYKELVSGGSEALRLFLTTPELAKEALTLGAAKLPIKAKFVTRIGDS